MTLGLLGKKYKPEPGGGIRGLGVKGGAMPYHPGGAELEPPVRTPHTVYVKTLYRVAGQDCCRHHVIRAAVAAGVIAEVTPGAGPVAATHRRGPATEYDQPHRR